MSNNDKRFLSIRLLFKPKFHLLGHVTTRHDSLSSPCILVQEKVVRAASRMLYSKRDAARHDERNKRDTSVTTSATGAIRNLRLFVMCIKL